MSIAVNLYYTGINGNARKFAEEMERSGTAGLIRAEPGNQRYAYFFPMDDPETVLLIDRWRDQDAIDKHHKSELMVKIAELIERVLDNPEDAENIATIRAEVNALMESYPLFAN